MICSFYFTVQNKVAEGDVWAYSLSTTVYTVKSSGLLCIFCIITLINAMEISHLEQIRRVCQHVIAGLSAQNINTMRLKLKCRPPGGSFSSEISSLQL